MKETVYITTVRPKLGYASASSDPYYEIDIATLVNHLMDIEKEKYLVPNNETRESHAFKYRIPKTSKDVFTYFPKGNLCLQYLPH